MRIFEDYEVSFHLDEPQADIMTHWGGQKNRIRVAPSSVLIKWTRSEKTNGRWECSQVTVFGGHVRKGSSNYIGIHYVGYGAQNDADPMPDWVIDLINCSHPEAKVHA